MGIKIISAGAGSGKTYRLTSEMVDLLKNGIRAGGIIATTFTQKAAAELEERVRIRLLQEGMTEAANELSNALIGTVHGLGVKLLKRFAFEAGVPPEVAIIAEEDQQALFNKSLATVLTPERIEEMSRLGERLGLNKGRGKDWRQILKQIIDAARANDFSPETLEKSKQLSFESLQTFLGEPSDLSPEEWKDKLTEKLEQTIAALETNEDQTKVTQKALAEFRSARTQLKIRGKLEWYEWVKLSKTKVGAKSREETADLLEWAARHDSNRAFHEDIRRFIFLLFDFSMEAIREFARFKKTRGLIDYIDMETLVNRLLDDPRVQSTLKEEIDLLMVDEFQDTSPIQLSIFHKLSRLVPESVWVGDPKQSIYGFRGADPRLMQAIIEANGGIKPENVQGFSWRSRRDIVMATNALFTKAFPGLSEEQIALDFQPKARPVKGKESQEEPIEMEDALLHWHFIYDGEGRPPGNPWFEHCIANSLSEFLANPPLIYDKSRKEYREARPGDVAILCRTNRKCQAMAEALHQAGLKSAIARKGLMETREIRLTLACLRLLLSPEDSLAVAEVMRLGSALSLEEIVENRLDFLEEQEEENMQNWDGNNPLVEKLNQLQKEVVDLSSSEIVDLLIEELDLRRIILGWGESNQRLDNLDNIRQLALQYEEACNRLHSGASLGGFLLWLDSLAEREGDDQAAGEATDCVNVLTYHRSKGLEWPVVICHDLENALQDSLFGLDIIAEKEDVELDDILGNRWLRYWINPYSDQYRNTKLEQRLEGSEAKATSVQKAREEEARLFYVGMTRARDYLIFPSREKPTAWLNRIWHEGQEDHPTLQPDSPETPWEWKGHFLHKNTRTFPYPRDFTIAEIPEKPAIFFKKGKKESIGFQAYHIDLHREWPDFGANLNPPGSKEWTYTNGLNIPNDIPSYDLAKYIKAFLSADYPSYPRDQRLTIAEDLQKAHKLDGSFPPDKLLGLSDAFFQTTRRFTGKKEPDMRKYPIQYLHEGRLFETVLDLLYTRPAEILFIQNSAGGGSPDRIRQKTEELKPWLYLSGKALQQIIGIRRVRPFLHFVLDGLIIEKPVIDLWE